MNNPDQLPCKQGLIPEKGLLKESFPKKEKIRLLQFDLKRDIDKSKRIDRILRKKLGDEFSDKSSEGQVIRERAIQLLQAFAFGVRAAKEEFPQVLRYPDDIIDPFFFLRIGEGENIAFNTANKGISISVSYLLESANQEIFKPWQTYRAGNNIEKVLWGTNLLRFVLAGYEEFDHFLYERDHQGELKETKSTAKVGSVAEYDAQDHEFRALQRQLTFVKRLREEHSVQYTQFADFEKTLDDLKNRITAARRYRDFQG